MAVIRRCGITSIRAGRDVGGFLRWSCGSVCVLWWGATIDNTRLAVAKILGDGTRKRSTLFGALQSHYVFEDRYGRLAWVMTKRKSR